MKIILKLNFFFLRKNDYNVFNLILKINKSKYDLFIKRSYLLLFIFKVKNLNFLKNYITKHKFKKYKIFDKNFIFFYNFKVFKKLNLYNPIIVKTINYNLYNLFYLSKFLPNYIITYTNFFLKNKFFFGRIFTKNLKFCNYNYKYLNFFFKKFSFNFNVNFYNSIFLFILKKIKLNKCFILFYFLGSINIILNKKIKNNFFIYNSNKSVKLLNFSKNLLMSTDFISYNFFNQNFSFISNKYLIKYFNFFYNYIPNNIFFQKFKLFNNYYPITIPNDSKNIGFNFFNKFKQNRNIDFIILTNKFFIPFLENLTQKKIYIKLYNNEFNKINNYYFKKIFNEYRYYQPQFLKNFLITDFLEILWYSFMLKDLKMISDWVTRLMETLNFKNHKKFLNFFQNFINKYSGMFIDVLGIKGFFFDIRGKVGVTGSSKKRHFCFKFGSLNKSSKLHKINFNQNLVRTYSGVLGLTYIISY